ncbi:pimeloyl-ACP methyl ester carboxylesterase [Flavobacterium arsenatis]|uniref:Pimeloyl-ACP methyl ester carboxylesterase n=1 Tax=Flavobacterium arsenatis TaxID=1484332 RepID=A0ABU1TPL5_9FLAO|nr:alpha/beta hydrolase [Flavobacterium arsenatis]MDR6967752.1 pimeloyl-ACP methyl ester carboxylesterase [Flavobacterium arsenatis]
MYKFAILLLLVVILSSCGTTKANRIDDYVFKKKTEKAEYIKSYNNALKLWKVPFKEEDIQTTSGTAHIIIAGPKDAEPLVLLHGMDASSTMWYPNIEAFSKNHRVYAIDFLMEPGKSVASNDRLNTEEVASWYNQIFQYYKLKKFKVVGASRGGWIATLLATQENSGISKLVLLSPAQTFESIDKKGEAMPALMLKLFPNEKKLKRTLDAFAFYPQKIDTIYKKQFYLANKYAKSNTSMLQMQPFSKEDLQKINIPVLVLIGDHDVINSEDSLEKATELIPKSKTEKIKDAGHFLTIDQAKLVNKMVVDFLD